MQTVKFFTLGCKVNQYDTQVIREQFIQAGFTELEDHLPADLCVINTCTVTHRADADSLNIVRRVKRENPGARIIVTGCLTELDEDKIRKACAGGLIVKNKDKSNILQRFFSYPSPTHLSASSGILSGISDFKGRTRAFLKIQDGCDYFCTYCKVPLVRGRSRSRPLDEIIAEAKSLVKNGFKEIVLCGICLGAYGRDLKAQSCLIDVVEGLEKIKGLLRVRLSSIEAGDVSQALIDKMAASVKLCRHLHIPIQSGDDDILRKMKRGFSRADYSRLFKRLKKHIPGIAITTDIMVGFPGESEHNFQNSVGLIKEISPLKTHIFSYSRRQKSVVAANASTQVDPRIIKHRVLHLRKIAQNCALRFRKQFLGQELDVLIEAKTGQDPGFWYGHSDNYLKVGLVSRRNLENRIAKVSLKNIKSGFILGELRDNNAKV